jgi:hypothetical protein
LIAAVSTNGESGRLWIPTIAGLALMFGAIGLIHWLHARGVGHLEPEFARSDLFARHLGEALLLPGLASSLFAFVHPRTPYAPRCVAMLTAMFSTFFLYVLLAGWALL